MHKKTLVDAGAKNKKDRDREKINRRKIVKKGIEKDQTDKQSKGVKKMLKTKKNIQSLSQDREQETKYITCGETFEEEWIQCQEYKDRAH